MGTDNVYATLYNADSVALSNGMLLRISANQRAVRAQADSAPHVQGLAGVNGSGIIGIGGPVNVVGAAVRQPVLCEPGLTLAAGETLYVSSTTAGRATNVAPALAIAIGTIEDTGSYAQDSRVYAALDIPASTTGGGGVFPGFGSAPPAIGPTSAGSSGLASYSDHTHPWLHVTNQAALDLVDAATMLDGQEVWVDVYKDSFVLTASTQAVAADVRRTALNKAGYLWIRKGFSPGWWNQVSWFVTSSALANNADDGASALTPISPQEWRRRTLFRWLPGTESSSMTMTVTADLGDNDYIQPCWSIGLRGGTQSLTINGAQTVVATGAISAATALNRATNTPNSITAGFSWATHVGRMVRLQGTTTTTAWATKDLGSNEGRLSEQSVNGVVGAGFAAATTAEVVTQTKVPGIHLAAGGPPVVFVNDCDFDPAAAYACRGDSELSNWNFTRCRFRGPVGNGSATGNVLNYTACGFVDRAFNSKGITGLVLNAQVNQAGNGLSIFSAPATENAIVSHTMQASPLSLGERTYLHESGSGSGNCAMFDLAAGQLGFNVGISAHIDIFAIYGSGNHATSVPISLLTAAVFSHPPGASNFTVTGGVGLRFLPGGVAMDVPLTQLPHVLGPGQQPGAFEGYTAKLTAGVGAVTSYAGKDSAPAANQAVPLRLATSERLALRLRSTVRLGALDVIATGTVFKNNVATAMVVTVAAGAAVGTNAVDSAHPTLFADDDEIDVVWTAPAGTGDLDVSTTIEFAT